MLSIQTSMLVGRRPEVLSISAWYLVQVLEQKTAAIRSRYCSSLKSVIPLLLRYLKGGMSQEAIRQIPTDLFRAIDDLVSAIGDESKWSSEVRTYALTYLCRLLEAEEFILEQRERRRMEAQEFAEYLTGNGWNGEHDLDVDNYPEDCTGTRQDSLTTLMAQTIH